MSEVIEEYIRRNDGMSEDAAFQSFLKQERIRQWVGQDPSRVERLRREFTRVWNAMHASPANGQQGAQQTTMVREAPPAPTNVPVREAPPARPSAPAPPQQPAPRPAAKPAASPATQPAAPATRPQPAQPAQPKPAPQPAAQSPPAAPRLQTGARRLLVLCPQCARMDVWLQGGDIGCRSCGQAFPDMLQLIPVKPVGPFEYVFGEGVAGYLKAGGVAVGLAALYAALRAFG